MLRSVILKGWLRRLHRPFLKQVSTSVCRIPCHEMLSLNRKCKDGMPNCPVTGWGMDLPRFTLTWGWKQQDGNGAHRSTGQAPSPSLMWTKRSSGSIPLDLQEFWENQITQITKLPKDNITSVFVPLVQRVNTRQTEELRCKGKYSPSAKISDWRVIHICNEKEFWIHKSKFWHWLCHLSYTSWTQITAC